MKKIYFQILTACLLAAITNACVEIQDILGPTITLSENDNTIEDRYYYGDSLKFTVNFKDNVAIVKSEVAITKFGSDITDTVNSWGVYVTEPDTLSGSRFVTRVIREEIPTVFKGEYLDTGFYIAYLSVEDRGGTKQEFSDTFSISSDITPPVIDDVIVNLPQNASGQYEACPNFVVPVSGIVTDNTQLALVGFEVGTSRIPYITQSTTLEDDEILLENFLTGGRTIRMPADLPQGATTVKVIAIDVFGNESSSSFEIFNDCDLETPTINITASEPTINRSGFTSIIEGQQFDLTSLEISDNKELDKVEFRLFNESNQVITSYERTSIGADNTVFTTADNLLFPSTPFTSGDIGETFTVIVKAFDLDGNVAEESIPLSVERDDLPFISSMDFLLNPGGPRDSTYANATNNATFVVTDIIADALAVDPSYINFILPEGKAEDDVGIESISMVWSHVPSGRVLNTVLLGGASGTPFIGGDSTPSVVKFSDYLSNSSLTFEAGLGTYRLDIIIEDTNSQRASFTYDFLY